MEDQISEYENIRDTVRQIIEDIDRLQARVKESEYSLRNASEGEEEWENALNNIRETLSHHLTMLQLSYAVISTSRRVSFTCKMPNQPGHSHHKVYTCTLDNSHKFCRSHDLQNCPLSGCGGALI